MPYDARKCISCGSCGGAHDADGAGRCPAEALRVAGREYTPDELVDELLEDQAFFTGEGGVTFSGGECLLQSEFVLECAKRLSICGIRVAIDTCGHKAENEMLTLFPDGKGSDGFFITKMRRI